MADKSAFIPVDVGSTTGGDVDMDAELFGTGKAPATKSPAAPAPVAASAPPAPVPVQAPEPPKSVEQPPPQAAKPKFQYKKAASFTKTYAGNKKK